MKKENNKIKKKSLEYRDYDFGGKYTIHSDGRIFSLMTQENT